MSMVSLMHKLIKFLGTIYVFLIPFYDLPKTFRSGIALSGLIGILLLGIIAVYYLAKKQIIIPQYFLVPFLIFMFVYVLSYFVNIYNTNEKSINHILFYLYSYIVYSIVTLVLLKEYGLKWYSVILSYSIVLVSIIGFIEISIYYFRGFDAYANFLNHGVNVGIFGGFPRLRSTFNEPSHYALFMICVLPIVFYSRNKLAIFCAIASLLLTFSASLFFGILLSCLYYFCRWFVKMVLFKKKYILKWKYIILFVCILIPSIVFISIFTLEHFIIKIVDVKNVDPYRYNAWQTAIIEGLKSPLLGSGPASYYAFLPLGVFNWYLQIFVEAGVIGLISLMCFLYYVYRKALKSKVPLTTFSIVAFVGQMISMNHYYIPGFWVLLSVIYYDSKIDYKNH